MSLLTLYKNFWLLHAEVLLIICILWQGLCGIRTQIKKHNTEESHKKSSNFHPLQPIYYLDLNASNLIQFLFFLTLYSALKPNTRINDHKVGYFSSVDFIASDGCSNYSYMSWEVLKLMIFSTISLDWID